MRGGFGRPRRQRSRLTGCVLWIIGLILVLVILSVLFGGFSKGTKVGGAGPARPVQLTASR